MPAFFSDWGFHPQFFHPDFGWKPKPREKAISIREFDFVVSR